MENKQQTPLQRLIARWEIESLQSWIGDDYSIGKDNQLRSCINQLKELLPYEREVIENAFENGMNAVNIHNLEQFYNQTFQTNE
jgi:hypothetical protein